jgi:CheY-like chemotaxis protein
MRVLVVDDFVPIAEYLGGCLRRSGYKVRMAYDGIEALRIAAEFRPHALISDIHMPGLDGFELAAAFGERFPNCRVVLATVDCGLVGASYDHRPIKVLQKPVSLADVIEFLTSCDADD